MAPLTVHRRIVLARRKLMAHSMGIVEHRPQLVDVILLALPEEDAPCPAIIPAYQDWFVALVDRVRPELHRKSPVLCDVERGTLENDRAIVYPIEFESSADLAVGIGRAFL